MTAQSLLNLLAVGTGGFLGAVTRYLVSGWLARYADENWKTSLPAGTFFINITGSTLMGLALAAFTRYGPPQSPGQLLLITGFLGAYTTFSTYTIESLSLLRRGESRTAVFNILGTNTLCLLGALLGLALGQGLWPA